MQGIILPNNRVTEDVLDAMEYVADARAEGCSPEGVNFFTTRAQLIAIGEVEAVS